MSKTKTAANAFIDLVTPNKPKKSPLVAAKEASQATPPYTPVYETKYLGGLDPIYSADMGEHIGKMLNTNPWDVMSRNQQIVSLGGKPVEDYIITHGGQSYARDSRHVAQGIGGASNEGITKRVQGRYDIASEEGLDQGGTGEVIASPHTMTDSSVNFATPVSDLYRSFFNRLATPAQYQQLTDELRNKIVSTTNKKTGVVTVRKPYANIPNMDDPEIDKWFADVPEFRKAFVNSMQNTKKWSEMVGLNPQDVLAAFKDENLIGVPSQYMGHTLIEAVPGAPIQPSINATYSHDWLGGYRGSTKDTPVAIMLNKPFSTIAQSLRAEKPDAPREDIAKWAVGALGSRKHGVSEMISPEMLRRIEDYHVGLKQDKFPPNDIGAALDYLELPRFADGGMVDSVPEEAIKNTVKAPQAARLLDLDLAKYALMNQPQRMMGGGAMKKIVKPAVKAVMPKLQGEFPPAMRPPEALQWTTQTDDMMTAPLKNGWTATLYHGGDKPELSIFNPFDQEMGAPKQYKDINEAMLAAPAWIEKGITPDGIRPGDPMTEGFAQGGAVRMAGGGTMKKIAKTVTKPALSQAEKDANLKQWMSSGKIRTDEGDPLRLYHATPKNFDQFKAGGDDPTVSGLATWLTDNPEYQPAAHNIGTRTEGVYKEGTNVMPVYSNASQPLLIDDLEMQQWANDVFAGGKDELPYMVSPNTAKAIKEAGYDYIHYADPHKSNEPHEYIMLDPERQIKSAIGNQGTYDTSNPDITKAHGGAVRMAQGGQVMSEAIGGQVQTPIQGDMGKMTFDQYRASIGMHEGGRHMAGGGQVQRFDDGGEVSQDQMRYELDRANNPVMQATPRSPIQDFIGMAGGYMDKAGKFVSEAIAPTAEKHPVKHFLANMFLADSLKGAGTLMQDLTGTAREADEDNPVRGVISKNWKNLTNSTEPLLDPRALDLAGFVTPVVKGATKLGQAGAKAITPFAKTTAEMAAELYGSGKMTGMVAPNAYMAEPSAPKPEKILAPANEQGFYSPTEAAALNLQRKTGNGQAFMNDLLKQENVRPDEIKAMGLDTFLKDKKNVTAAEVQDYIAQNKLGLGESVYGGKQKGNFLEFLKDKGYPDDEALRILNKAEDGNMDGQVSALRDEYLDLSVKPTKFQGYQLPGGENYREVVLTMPNKPMDIGDAAQNYYKNFVQRGGEPNWSELPEVKQQEIISSMPKQAKDISSSPEYRSSHWDEPNVLAHLRMSDRVTDGKKTLLVDEVQSDWHQAGREQGYAKPETARIKGTVEEQPSDFGFSTEYQVNWENGTFSGGYGSREIAQEVADAGKSNAVKGVPDAPYKEDWYQLALRRAVKEAIDGGYDRVALPTGARVNERFSLTKHVDAVRANLNPDGTYAVGVKPIGKNMQKFDQSVPADKLASILGKDLANKITSEVNEVGVESGKVFSGLDLKVGGEGNRKYYDEIYPGYLKKFGKKYGASIGKTTVDADGVAEPLHYMDITPAMRKEFSTGIHMAKGGKVSFAKSADEMRKELLRNKHG